MIYIPFEVYKQSIGGPATFMKNLQEYLLKRSYKFISNQENYKEADSIFFPISFDEKILKYFKNESLPIIQRLDGVYYPSKHGLKYIYFNRKIKIDYLKYSDFVIFQSEYSKIECFTMLGKIQEEKYKIIYNGADKSLFYPKNKTFIRSKIIFITTGFYRNKDMIEPVVLALDAIKNKYNFELRLIGPVTDNKVKKLMEREYVIYLGVMDKKNIAKELQKSDILIHCQLNPACPNSVIESISCGVPVVGFDTGAMKEVLFFAPELLAYVSDDTFQRYQDFKYERLIEKVELCIEHYNKFKDKFVKYSYLYNFENTFEEYLSVFKMLKQNNLNKVT
jgi:glycosyltransferase involved in cell wall biosynthesis